MRILRFSFAWSAFSLLVILGALPARISVEAATFVPTGFTEALVASGIARPTAMQFAPDGRLFVCEQGGRLRVIENDVLLPTPFVTLSVNASGERGLLGVAFDPAFASNHFVYVYSRLLPLLPLHPLRPLRHDLRDTRSQAGSN